jgi:hypothetical protein
VFVLDLGIVLMRRYIRDLSSHKYALRNGLVRTWREGATYKLGREPSPDT